MLEEGRAEEEATFSGPLSFPEVGVDVRGDGRGGFMRGEGSVVGGRARSGGGGLLEGGGLVGGAVAVVRGVAAERGVVVFTLFLGALFRQK